jgi:DNA-binding XRE family transcriptional regulator
MKNSATFAVGSLRGAPPRRSGRAAWSVRVDLIEQARVLSGRTRERLAADAHVDPKTLRDMLNERRRPTVGTVHCVLRVLELDPRDVIAFEPGTV